MSEQKVNLYQKEVGTIKTKIHKLEGEYKQAVEAMTQIEDDVNEVQVLVENLENKQ